MTRRTFLQGASALSAGVLLGLPHQSRAEPPPEVNKIRLIHNIGICLAPQYLAKEFLQLEGFDDVEYVELKSGVMHPLIENGAADITMDAAPAVVYGLGQGENLVVLGGIHAGCYELFGHSSVRAIRDLKGRKVAIYSRGGGDHILLSSMLAYVGMDPQSDVHWLADKQEDAMRMFVAGDVDAFMGFAPQPQYLREKGIGRVIVNTSMDRPWSQYFCCVVVANREFTIRHPVATKRALRALLRATDLCAQDSERAARLIVEKGFEPRYDVALSVLRELPYSRWREAHPEDTLRFHALRLHEAGMLKLTPQKLIERGTDWRFLNELKRELKA
jgi:NitT/TauT family transport system substrate-binding protein